MNVRIYIQANIIRFGNARPIILGDLNAITEYEIINPLQNRRVINYILNIKKIKEIVVFIKPFHKICITGLIGCNLL